MTIEAGKYDSRIPCTRMDYTAAVLMGVTLGAHPLAILQPDLTTEIVQTYVDPCYIRIFGMLLLPCDLPSS